MTEPNADAPVAVRQLREIGLDERTAGAIVDLLRRGGPDDSAPPTREDLTAARQDVQALRLELHGEVLSLERRIAERLRVQALAILGGVAALLAITAIILKLM